MKRVTSNKGKNTAGVDHELWKTPKGKFEAIDKLKRRGYKPQPLRRVYIPKKNGKITPAEYSNDDRPRHADII